MIPKKDKRQSLNRRRQYLLYYSVTRRIPDPIKRLLRTIYYIPIDIIDNLRGRDDLTPPAKHAAIPRAYKHHAQGIAACLSGGRHIIRVLTDAEAGHDAKKK